MALPNQPQPFAQSKEEEDRQLLIARMHEQQERIRFVLKGGGFLVRQLY